MSTFMRCKYQKFKNMTPIIEINDRENATRLKKKTSQITQIIRECNE